MAHPEDDEHDDWFERAILHSAQMHGVSTSVVRLVIDTYDRIAEDPTHFNDPPFPIMSRLLEMPAEWLESILVEVWADDL
jgi:hypothetical protein